MWRMIPLLHHIMTVVIDKAFSLCNNSHNFDIVKRRMNMTILDQILLLVTGLLYIYILWRFYGR